MFDSMGSILEALSPEQQIACTAPNNILLTACPGSGKTYIIGKKVLKYLKCWNLKYSGVAILSFTNVASKEIQRQIEELDEAKLYEQKLIKNLDGLQDYMKVGYLMDRNNLLDKKDSPVDKGKKVFQKLISERIYIN